MAARTARVAPRTPRALRAGRGVALGVSRTARPDAVRRQLERGLENLLGLVGIDPPPRAGAGHRVLPGAALPLRAGGMARAHRRRRRERARAPGPDGRRRRGVPGGRDRPARGTSRCARGGRRARALSGHDVLRRARAPRIAAPLLREPARLACRADRLVAGGGRPLRRLRRTRWRAGARAREQRGAARARAAARVGAGGRPRSALPRGGRRGRHVRGVLPPRHARQPARLRGADPAHVQPRLQPLRRQQSRRGWHVRGHHRRLDPGATRGQLPDHGRRARWTRVPARERGAAPEPGGELGVLDGEGGRVRAGASPPGPRARREQAAARLDGRRAAANREHAVVRTRRGAAGAPGRRQLRIPRDARNVGARRRRVGGAAPPGRTLARRLAGADGGRDAAVLHHGPLPDPPGARARRARGPGARRDRPLVTERRRSRGAAPLGARGEPRGRDRVRPRRRQLGPERRLERGRGPRAPAPRSRRQRASRRGVCVRRGVARRRQRAEALDQRPHRSRRVLLPLRHRARSAGPGARGDRALGAGRDARSSRRREPRTPESRLRSRGPAGGSEAAGSCS